MSLFQARKRSTEVAATTTEKFSNRCAANGCQLRGTIAPGGGRYVCSYHYAAESEDWPRVTEALHDNENLLLGIDEVIRIGDIDWSLGKWEMMQKFFAGEPELQPTVAERQHRRWYQYRLNAWVMYLAGITSRKPEPREALKPQAPRGNLGSLLVRQ